ncbi:MAG: M48 family metalloprotease [Armatimonadetes bacterium]|nr:M48 family metalloprotease [Armatimonadota bacterium]
MFRAHRVQLLRAGVVVLSVAAGLLMSGCSEDDVEKSLGDASAASVEQAYDVDNDPLISEWVNLAGQTLVSQCRRQNLPYEFKVIDTGMVNAFAAPYGHIYVTSGFLKFAETEDEVWMVLGHEIGHVVNRDSIKSLKRGLIWSILNAVLTSQSETAGEITGIGLGLLSLRYSRIDEYEADDSGTLLCYRAGYDPHMGLRFFDRLMTKLEKGRPSSWEVYFMTHPPTERRIARQMKREELSEDDVESLVQIGHGYLRRACPSRAVTYLGRAAQIAPDLAQVQVELGDAYATRGDIERALESYQAALEVSPGNDHARVQLAALSDAQPWAPPGMSDTDREKAGRLLARADNAGRDIQDVHVNAVNYSNNMSDDLTHLRNQVKSINQRVIDLGDQQADLTKGLQRLVSRGGASVARATESVYVLDNINEDFQAIDGELNGLLAQCRRRLEAAQQGKGDPAELDAIRSALDELERGAATAQVAMSHVPETVEAVRRAQSAAANTTSLLEQLVRTEHGRDLVAERLRAAATHTTEQAVDALRAVRRARQRITKARGHALVARLNLLGAGAGPYLETVFDRQVAHFLMCPPRQVRALRAEGAGYGEAAVAIAAARSLGARPDHFLTRNGRDVSPVNLAASEGASVRNANVLLRFLAAAMEAERAAEQDDAGEAQQP